MAAPEKWDEGIKTHMGVVRFYFTKIYNYIYIPSFTPIPNLRIP